MKTLCRESQPLTLEESQLLLSWRLASYGQAQPGKSAQAGDSREYSEMNTKLLEENGFQCPCTLLAENGV